jgi:hypothetical protein
MDNASLCVPKSSQFYQLLYHEGGAANRVVAGQLLNNVIDEGGMYSADHTFKFGKYVRGVYIATLALLHICVVCL